MLSILFFIFLSVSLGAFLPSGRIPPSRSDTNCPTSLVRKTLEWNFILSLDASVPQLVNYTNLTAPGSGFAWRGEAYYTPDVTRPILFQNSQGWRLINCTSYFTADDRARRGCTSPDFALLSIPGTQIGDAPPDKGKIGSIQAPANPSLSVWAVYDLIQFNLTPVLPPRYYENLINIEIFGWRENGSITDTRRLKIKGSEVGYKIELPKGKWNNIVQWQVRVWWSDGSRATRENFPFIIDDVVIDEHALDSIEYHCRYPEQVPCEPPNAIETLGFDDIVTTPGASTVVPSPYHGFVFDQRWSLWNVTNPLTYPAGHPGRHSGPSKPNSILATPKKNGEWSYDPSVIRATNFLFDVDSFHITIDNRTTTTQKPGDIVVMVNAIGPCFIDFMNPYTDGAFAVAEATSYSFHVDLTASGFHKYYAITIQVIDSVSSKYIPFWIDNMKVRSWKVPLDGLPGCERCGYGMDYWCEYPHQERPEIEVVNEGGLI